MVGAGQSLPCGSRASAASALRATLTGMSSSTAPPIEVRCGFPLTAASLRACEAAASSAALLGALEGAAFAVLACVFPPPAVLVYPLLLLGVFLQNQMGQKLQGALMWALRRMKRSSHGLF